MPKYGNGQDYVVVDTEGNRPTYRYCVSSFTLVATPTAFLVIQGAGSQAASANGAAAPVVVRVKRIKIVGIATAAGNMPFQAFRRSSAGTLGSAVLTALVPSSHDITDPPALATVSTVGTANYTTLGTSKGQVHADRIGFSASGSGAVGSPLILDFCTRDDKALILRGTSDFLTLEGAGGAIPAGGVIDIEVETEEDIY